MDTSHSNPVNIDDGGDSEDSIKEMEINLSLSESQLSDVKGKNIGLKKRKLKSDVWE